MVDRSHYVVVAALEFGITQSGFSFSFNDKFKEDPRQIYNSHVWHWYNGYKCSLKCPTCVLLDKNKGLDSFGYEAEHKYSNLCMNEEQDEYYFFRGFFTEKNFSRDMVLVDVTGKSIPACLVFRIYIEAFVSYLVEIFDKKGITLTEREWIWVIPVSADLTDTGKQFLRSCAAQARICSDKLMFVTEAEAAFMYCQHLPDQDHSHNLKDGTECMVVYIGGCDTDITVLKKDVNQVIEKYRTTRIACGDTSVNNSFLELLDTIFGSQVMTSLRKEDPSALLDLEKDFEAITHFKYSLRGKIKLNIPYFSLDTLCKKYFDKDPKDVISSSIYGNGIRLRVDRMMQIDSDIIHNLCKPTIDKIISLMENVFADYKDSRNVKEIVMVGDFSESGLVQDAVKQTFSNTNIIIPECSGRAVMHGAVLCGHQPCQYSQISSSEMKAAQTSVTKCIFCDNPSVYHCIECKSVFCQLCRTNHDKLPTTKTHTITDLKKIDHSAFSTNAKCVSHKTDFIYFCTQCRILICGKCVTTEHKGHDITNIKNIADDNRRSAEKNISDLKVAITKLSKVVGLMTEIEKPTIKRTYESAVSEIDETVQKITRVVSFKKENKMDEVQSQLDMEMEEFQYDLNKKERIYEHQKNICESLERLMHVSHDITFITSYETLKRDIHDISDLLEEREQKQVYKFDNRVFVQEVVNAIVSGFEMSLVGKEDGSVGLMHRTEKQNKEKEKKQK